MTNASALQHIVLINSVNDATTTTTISNVDSTDEDAAFALDVSGNFTDVDNYETYNFWSYGWYPKRR